MATMMPAISRPAAPPLRRALSDGPAKLAEAYTTTEIPESSTVTQPPTSPFRMQQDDVDGESLAAQYQLMEELGSGSFGVVYKAIEKSTGEIVAVKHVDLESSEEDLSDIISELAVLSSCSSPYVTKYKSAFLRKQTLWIVMEYLGGGSCADLLKPPPHHLNEAHIAIICRELLLGLSYLHGEGKLHRDIKAANVLLGMDGRVKLADFGVAAQLTGLKSIRNTFVGTPFWMAPEVIQQEGHDAKADIWSLGITAMELANGQPPHANVHPMKVLFLIPKQPAPRLDNGQWSKDFRDFVARCLTKDSDYRPNARDLLKHRFIRHAGRVDGLQELLQGKQQWESSRGSERQMKYYAETLKQIKRPDVEEEDDWVFDTIKPGAPIQTQIPATQRRKGSGRPSRKVSKTVIAEDITADLEDMSIVPSTMRRISQKYNRQSPSANSSVRRSTKRLSSDQSQPPLSVNMSFGNSPSALRQFRRVSPTGDIENANPLQIDQTVKTELQSDEDFWNDTSISMNDATVIKFDQTMHDASGPPSPSPTSCFSSQKSQTSTVATSVASLGSKETMLGKQLYSHAIGIACQNVLDSTANQNCREAVSRLAEAFSDLEAADPEGLYHIMSNVIGRMQDDPKLNDILPQSMSTLEATSVMFSRSASSCASTYDSGTVQRSPNKATSAVNTLDIETTRNTTTPPASPTKLVMAQNNPHLKSHRRRQSAQVKTSSQQASHESNQVWHTPKMSASTNTSILSTGSAGTGGSGSKLDKINEEDIEIKEIQHAMGRDEDGKKKRLTHTTAMEDMLFGRWVEGLAAKWSTAV